jgi:hypothetical protein
LELNYMQAATRKFLLLSLPTLDFLSWWSLLSHMVGLDILYI